MTRTITEQSQNLDFVEAPKPILTDEEIRYARKTLGREPNQVEWAMLEAQWSEHCSYKSSKPLLKQLPSKGSRVLIGPGFDAGVIDVGDGWVVTLHIESHNHPSAIDPYGGAATGVGGVVRDILSLGTRPIALLDPLRFGSIESQHTRWLFDNVVRGIADYGNCVSGEDLVYFTNSDSFHVSSFESFFDDFSKNKPYSIEYRTEGTTILKPKYDVKVLSFDFERHRSCFRQVKRVYRISVPRLLKIHTTLGRVISVTPDHPMFVMKNGLLQVSRAMDLAVDDEVPILCDYPHPDRPLPYEIDVIAELVSSGLDELITLRPASIRLATLKEKFLPLFKKAGVESQQWCHYFRENYLPLKVYLKLERTGDIVPIAREDLLVHPRRGRVNPIPAVLPIDETFARLIGYFLSEGCRYDEKNKSGNTSRLVWTFREDEKEYIEDVCSILEGLKIRYTKRQNSPTTVQVKVSSGVLGFLFREVIACGKDSYSKSIPSIFYKLGPSILYELLKGVIRGDGSIRTSSSQPVGIRYASCSVLLFQQILLLLQSLGYVASTRTFRNRKSTVPLYELEVHGVEQVGSLKGIFSSHLISKADLRLRESKSAKLARPRFNRYERYATVKVTETEELTGNFQVYNFEVDGTHNYVTSGGIITHNCIGVPTVGGEVEFDTSFERNCLVDVACIGLGRKDKLVLGEARNPGDLVYLIGGRTGRDGIRGASFASKTLTEKSDRERSAVQVPDPLSKKLIIEAVLEALDAGIIRGMKDLGGGGLTCGLSELADKAETGMEIDLDKVETREPGMVSAEVMISESQERMLLLIQEKNEKKLVNILERWELGYSKIGRVTREKLLVIRKGDRIVAKAPAKFVAEAPLSHRSARRPGYLDALAEVPGPVEPRDLDRILVELLSDPNIASKEWIYRQYDHEVGIRTIVKPGIADAAILRLPNHRSLAITADGNSKQCYVDPYWGTMGIVSEAFCNLAANGAEPIGVVDHLQYGDPGNPEVYWTFKEAIRAISNYLKALNVPCVGGKVSFYNEDATNHKAIKPSPVIAALGLIEPEKPRVLQALKKEGNDLVAIGNTLDEMGGTEYYEQVHMITGGLVPRVNLKKEKPIQRNLIQTVRNGQAESAHDISKGGLAVALAEMAIQGGKGFIVDLDKVPNKTTRLDNLLFSESRSRFIIETRLKNTSRIIGSFKRLGIPASKVGSVTGQKVEFVSKGERIVSIPIAEAAKAWSETIPRAMEATL